MESKRKRDGHQVIPYPLRLPPALREQLQAQAARNQRSLNGESQKYATTSSWSVARTNWMESTTKFLQ